MTDNFLRTPWRMEGSSAVDNSGQSLVGRFCLGSDSKDWPALVDAVNAGANIEALRQDAFELGVKSAGGSIIPDRSKFVELALDRSTINALAQAAEAIIGVGLTSHEADEALTQFLEVVSIHRSRK